MSFTPPGSQSFTQVQSGAAVQPQYGTRKMQMYLINEAEVNQLSSLNGLATIFFSLGSFLASAAIGIYVNAIFYDTLTPAGAIAKGYVVPTVGIVSLAFFGIAFYSMYQRSNVWKTIRRESGTP